MNNDSLVITIAGPDRPGIVDTISRTIAAHGGNWEESRMARLAGTFAGILKVSVPAPNVEALSRSLDTLRGQTLHVFVAPSQILPVPPDAQTINLNLIGADHPGIIRDVSRVLADRSVNIEELVTETVEAPMAGQMLFKASAELRMPPGLTAEELRVALERLADDLVVEIALEAEAGSRG